MLRFSEQTNPTGVGVYGLAKNGSHGEGLVVGRASAFAAPACRRLESATLNLIERKLSQIRSGLVRCRDAADVAVVPLKLETYIAGFKPELRFRFDFRVVPFKSETFIAGLQN